MSLSSIRRPDSILLVLCLLLPTAMVMDGVCSPPDFDTEFEFGPGVQSLSADDLDHTYGLLPSFGVAVSWLLVAQTRLVIGARYACSRGDPYYDMPEFRSGDDATLRAVPLTFGVRGNLNPGSRLRYHIGCALQLAWLQETVPVDGGPTRFTGYGIGPLVTSGPEWRSRDERRALGLEFAWGGRGGQVDHGTDRHDVDLTGIHVRLYYVCHPGAAAPGEGGSR